MLFLGIGHGFIIYRWGENAKVHAQDYSSLSASLLEKRNIPRELPVTGCRVSFFKKKSLGILIESAEVAQAMRYLFEIFWEKTEKNT